MYLLLFINQTDAYDYAKYSKTHCITAAVKMQAKFVLY